MVEEMGKMDNVVMENMAPLSENMFKMASTIANTIASIRAVLIPQAPFYPRIPPFSMPVHPNLPAYHGSRSSMPTSGQVRSPNDEMWSLKRVHGL